ncbi:hypothetical protein Tco_0516409 [Tanacetum coccineum]
MFKIYNLCINLVDFADMALPPKDQRHQFLRFEELQYTDADIPDFEMRLGKIYRREVHRVQVFDFRGLTELMDEGLRGRMLIEHMDTQGQISVKDPMLKLCHMLIACSIAERSQELKKGAMISEGQFVARLIKHFGLLTEERLKGLTVIVRDLPVIDMVVVAGALEAVEYAPVADEGAPAILTPVQAPQPPHPIAEPSRTMAQSMACGFSRFSTWIVVGLSQMMSQDKVRYTSYADFQIPYVRHTRRKTDGASTSTAQQDEQ